MKDKLKVTESKPDSKTISSLGIHHTDDGKWYLRTVITSSKGELISVKDSEPDLRNVIIERFKIEACKMFEV